MSCFKECKIFKRMPSPLNNEGNSRNGRVKIGPVVANFSAEAGTASPRLVKIRWSPQFTSNCHIEKKKKKIDTFNDRNITKILSCLNFAIEKNVHLHWRLVRMCLTKLAISILAQKQKVHVILTLNNRLEESCLFKKKDTAYYLQHLLLTIWIWLTFSLVAEWHLAPNVLKRQSRLF